MTAREQGLLIILIGLFTVILGIVIMLMSNPPRTPQPEAVSKPKPEDMSKETQQERNVKFSR